MLPSLSANNGRDSALMNSKTSSNIDLTQTCRIQGANFFDFSFGKPYVSVADTFGLSALLVSICGVFDDCAGKKMVGIAALAIVAFVANKHPIWQRAIVQLVRNAMTKTLLAAIGEPSVTTTLEVPLPFPTLVNIGRGYIEPKFCFEGWRRLAMVKYIAQWLTPDVSMFQVILARYLGLLTATALAISNRNFIACHRVLLVGHRSILT